MSPWEIHWQQEILQHLHEVVGDHSSRRPYLSSINATEQYMYPYLPLGT